MHFQLQLWSTFFGGKVILHGERYSYEQVRLSDSKQKVTILCRKHGAFAQAPSEHLAGKGCAKCRNESNANRQRQPTSDFIERARLVHGEKFDYSLVEYSSARRKVRIRCPVHGVFEQTPDTHIHAGCRKCADDALPGAYSERRFGKNDGLGDIDGVLYYARFTADDGETFYKVGISRNSAAQRFAGYGGGYGYRMELLGSRTLSLRVAYQFEQRVLKEHAAGHPYVPSKLSKTGRRFGGRTECFQSPLPEALLSEIFKADIGQPDVSVDVDSRN